MEIPQYKMSRTIFTITDTWREWETGILPEMLAVKTLEERYGTKWRRNPTETKFFNRRKRIIDAVDKIRHAKGWSGAIAAGVLEGKRVQSGNKALNWLCTTNPETNEPNISLFVSEILNV